ncbi:MAG: hypothetical protein QXL94_05475 [Candidatus Parvarchaeum sp.]
MLAVYGGKSAKQEIIGFIKVKGWIGSDATLYGYKGSPGILEKVVNAGFVKETMRKYALTGQESKWIDLEMIITNQSDKLSSEERKRLMIKVIEKLHESNMLVVTSSIKHSPDLIVWKPNQGKEVFMRHSKRNGL